MKITNAENDSSRLEYQLHTQDRKSFTFKRLLYLNRDLH